MTVEPRQGLDLMPGRLQTAHQGQGEIGQRDSVRCQLQHPHAEAFFTFPASVTPASAAGSAW